MEVLMEIFPEAPVYTLLYDEAKTQARFRGRIKQTSLLDFQFVRDNHRLFIPAMPVAARLLDLGNEYDLIISDSAGYAKGVSYGKNTKHISYIHTPLRYAWETDYLNFKLSRPLWRGSPLAATINFQFWKKFLTPVINYLKNWDYRAGQRPDLLIANSNFIADKIKKYYKREAKIIYPPVDKSKFFYAPIRTNKPISHPYYLAAGRLLHYKKFDLIIEAFAKLGLPLKIVGAGPELDKLKAKSEKRKANVEFLAFVSDDELRKLYHGAKALIFPQIEDFGLVAAEAQACGTPVIAYAAGGALEIVEDGKTGVLFPEQTADSLTAAVKKFEGLKFLRRSIAAKTKRFSKENFKKQILDIVQSLS